MNTKLTDLIRKARNPSDKSFRNSLYIFLICCIISLSIWFLIKMSDDYVAEIRMPVNYQNAPADKLLVKAENKIWVRVRAQGSDIFSAKYLSDRRPLNINLNQAEVKKSRYFDRYYILTNQFRNQFSNRFEFAHSILGLSPDTLYLNFEAIITRELPVKARLDIRLKPQFQIYDSIILEPATVRISGPASLIDTMAYVPTEKKQYHELDSDVEAILSLQPRISNEKIDMDRSNVRIFIPVQEYTEDVMEVPVMALSTHPDHQVKTFPETIRVTYKVALKDYKLIKPDMFVLSAFYDETLDREKKFLKVVVDEKPDYVKISRLKPEKVEFLIQK